MVLILRGAGTTLKAKEAAMTARSTNWLSSPGEWTLADVQALPEKSRVEVIDGTLIVNPGPLPVHQPGKRSPCRGGARRHRKLGAGEYLPADVYRGRLTADEPFPIDIDLTKLTR
jgi:hypothetical protein